MSGQPIDKANANAVLFAGVVLVLAALGAYIYCEQVHINSVPVLGFVGPFAAALLVAQRLDKLQATAAGAREEAATAARQTNGALSDKIRTIVGEVVHEELRARDIQRDTSKAALAATAQTA